MTTRRTGRSAAAAAMAAFLMSVMTTACGSSHTSTASTTRKTEAPAVTTPAADDLASPAAMAQDLKDTDSLLNNVDAELSAADDGLGADEGDLTK